MLFGPVTLSLISNNAEPAIDVGISFQAQYAYAQDPEQLQNFDPQSASLSEYGVSCGASKAIACGIGQIFVVWIFYGGTSFVARAMAGLFDFFLWYTMQASTYVGADYVENAWGIMRDFANILFLIALIYAGISIMFESFQVASLANGKKVLAHVIVSAVLVNFSFFFTGALIDASHILSRAFYNKIEADACTDANANSNIFCQDQPGVDYTQFSAGVMARMNPQSIITDSRVLQSSTAADSGLISLFFIIYFLGGILNIILIGVFFTLFFLMLGRTVSLIYSLIISPLAVATVAIPQLRKQKFIGFDNWISNLTKDALMLPVFMFFLYMIVIFMSPDFIDGLKEAGLGDDGYDGASMGQRIIQILIPVAFIMTMLLVAKKTAQMLAGDITNIVSSSVKNVTNKAMGFAGGLALTGGAGLVTRGALATSKIGSKLLPTAGSQLQSTNRIVRGIGSARVAAQNRLENSTFDVRNTYVGRQLGSQLQSASGIDLGTGTTKTISSRQEAAAKRVSDRAELESKAIAADIEEKKEAERQVIDAADNTILAAQTSPEYRAAEARQRAKIAKAKQELKEAEAAQNKLVEDRQKDLAAIDSNPSLTPAEKEDQKKAMRQLYESQIKAEKDKVNQKKKEKEKQEKSLEDGSFYGPSGHMGEVIENDKKQVGALARLVQLAEERKSSRDVNRQVELDAEIEVVKADMAADAVGLSDKIKELNYKLLDPSDPVNDPADPKYNPNLAAEVAEMERQRDLYDDYTATSMDYSTINKADLDRTQKSAAKNIKDYITDPLTKKIDSRKQAQVAYVQAKTKKEVSETKVKELDREQKVVTRKYYEQALNDMQGFWKLLGQEIGKTVGVSAGATVGAGTLGWLGGTAGAGTALGIGGATFAVGAGYSLLKAGDRRLMTMAKEQEAIRQLLRQSQKAEAAANKEAKKDNK